MDKCRLDKSHFINAILGKIDLIIAIFCMATLDKFIFTSRANLLVLILKCFNIFFSAVLLRMSLQSQRQQNNSKVRFSYE